MCLQRISPFATLGAEINKLEIYISKIMNDYLYLTSNTSSTAEMNWGRTERWGLHSCRITGILEKKIFMKRVLYHIWDTLQKNITLLLSTYFGAQSAMHTISLSFYLFPPPLPPTAMNHSSDASLKPVMVKVTRTKQLKESLVNENIFLVLI